METLKCEVNGCEALEFKSGSPIVAWNLLDLQVRGNHPQIGQNRAAAVGNGQQNTPKLKIARPTINEKEDESRWEMFALEWENYKTYNGLNTRDQIVLELKQCCDGRLRQMAALNTESEEDLLKRMKKVAVHTKSANAHRSEFSQMRQEQGELFMNWAVRLRDKAALCQFIHTSQFYQPVFSRIFGGLSLHRLVVATPCAWEMDF